MAGGTQRKVPNSTKERMEEASKEELIPIVKTKSACGGCLGAEGQGLDRTIPHRRKNSEVAGECGRSQGLKSYYPEFKSLPPRSSRLANLLSSL